MTVIDRPVAVASTRRLTAAERVQRAMFTTIGRVPGAILSRAV